MREVLPTRQVPGEPSRRWFVFENAELIVWCDGDGAPTGFQLCYTGDGLPERALTWRPDIGFVHHRVDDGEGGGGLRHKATPVLLPDGTFDAERLRALVSAHAGALPDAIREFVTAKLAEHAAAAHGTSEGTS